MKKNSNAGSGVRCAFIALCILILTVLISFPGLIPGAFGKVPPYGFALMAAMMALYAFLVKFPSLVRYFWLAFDNAMPLVVAVLGGAVTVVATVYVISSAVETSVQILRGHPVDDLGTIVSMSPITLLALHSALLIFIACLGRHLIFPALKLEGSFVRGTVALLASALVYFFVSFLGGALVVDCYRDKTAEKRAELTSQIDRHKAAINELEVKLQELKAQK